MLLFLLPAVLLKILSHQFFSCSLTLSQIEDGQEDVDDIDVQLKKRAKNDTYSNNSS
jgi:hypothetical protein